jgi:hypothetical protein
MNNNDTNKLMAALAPSDDSIAVTKFIEKFKREPKTNNGDWSDVQGFLPATNLKTADRDYGLSVWRAKKAIVNYWKSKRMNSGA